MRTVPWQSVEHSCYQCKAAVEDGVAFCPHCSAPQIRVMAAGAVGEEIVPEAGAEKPSYRGSPATSKIDWAQVLAAVFLGLFITLFLSFLFRGGGGLPLGMLTTGYLSVYFYNRRNPFNRLTVGLGARLGALSGALGFGILAVAGSAAVFASHSGAEIHALVLKAVQNYSGGNSDPQMQQILQIYNSHEGFILMLIAGAVVMLVVSTALSSVGGMIGVAILRRKHVA